MKTNGTPPPDDPSLTAALRTCADGLYPAEATAELLISHAFWLCRDFRDSAMDGGTSITDGTTLMAARTRSNARYACASGCSA